MDCNIRELRLMQFTSLLIQIAHIPDPQIILYYGRFCEYEHKNPLIDGYTRTGRQIDHSRMVRFITKLKEDNLL